MYLHEHEHIDYVTKRKQHWNLPIFYLIRDQCGLFIILQIKCHSTTEHYCCSCWLLKIEAYRKQWTMTVTWPANRSSSCSGLFFLHECVFVCLRDGKVFAQLGRKTAKWQKWQKKRWPCRYCCSISWSHVKNICICICWVAGAQSCRSRKTFHLWSKTVPGWIPFTDEHNWKWALVSGVCFVRKKSQFLNPIFQVLTCSF